MRTINLLVLGLVASAAAGSLEAQAAPARTAPITDQLRYLLAQSSSGFRSLRGDSLGGGTWRNRQVISGELDSATIASGSTISELDRPRADGRPGKTIVAVFPLASATDSTHASVYTRYRDLIAGALPSWQNRSTDGGDWTECPDPKRGREVILSTSRTVAGALLIVLSITVLPDPTCT
jgi:hypothetical protein